MAPAMEPLENRYAPPKALALELPPEAPPDRSRHVEWACKLMWSGVGVSIISSLQTFFNHLDSAIRSGELVEEFFGLAIGIAIVYWFTNKLRAGRNWMRLLITILNAIMLVILASLTVMLISRNIGTIFLARMFEAAPIDTVSALLQFVLGLIELILINTPGSRAWFASKKFAG